MIGASGFALTGGGIVLLATQAGGFDGQGIGYMLGGLAAVITATGGLVLAFRKPRRDLAEEMLLKLLAEKAGLDADELDGKQT